VLKEIYSNLKQWVHYSINYKLESFAEVVETIDGCWHWLGNEPKIRLTPNVNVPLKGYYMLELTVCNLFIPLNCQLFQVLKNDCRETKSFNMSVSPSGENTKIIKRICHFDHDAKELYFQPSDEPGRCGRVSVRLVKLSENKTLRLMLKKRALRIHTSILNCSTEVLYQKYDDLFHKNGSSTYREWIAYNENESSVDKIQHTAPPISPLISIICPIHNTKIKWLAACIESVMIQSYSNWELILIDDASKSTDHFQLLKELPGGDERIKVRYLKDNVHISAATNVGISLAKGDYVTFLDHDDELSSNALFEIYQVINTNPSAKIIYSDEDLMSESGDRIAPHFKSDWNIELLRAHNYVTHLCCYEATLLNNLGGMRLGYEGAQDYDLILRASIVVDAKDIFHIPKILYHWRMVEGSTALSSGAKSYATEAGLKALTDHTMAIGISAIVSHANRENFYTINYPLPAKLPKVSIVIPTRDGMDVLKSCIESLLKKTTYAKYEVIILDNGSEEVETLNFLHELSLKPNFKILRDEGGFNYSRINNVAVKHSTGELVCLLNNDIEIINKNWLSEMVSIAIREEVGCVGAKLLYPDGTIQHAGVILGLGGYAAHSHRGVKGTDAGYFCRAQVRQQLSAVTGACLLVRRTIYDLVGGLDEAFKVAYNDVDFCLRVQSLGYQNIYTPFAELIHHESRTRGEDTGTKKMKRFDKEKKLLSERWSSQLKNDPFYNPNLTRTREDFSI
jgi:GT2 family glycosyltransferase